jgi:hypothetical protein
VKKLEPLCTVAEAVEILHIDEKTVRRRIKTGRCDRSKSAVCGGLIRGIDTAACKPYPSR